MLKIGEIKRIIAYLFVGIGATVVEWSAFYVLNVVLSINYFIATPLAFAFSTYANYILGRVLAFSDCNIRISKRQEISTIYVISLGGLLLNLLIMWVCVDYIAMSPMVAKMLATFLVFAYNYALRRLLIYR